MGGQGFRASGAIMVINWWKYENLERRGPYDWSPAAQGDNPWDHCDFHIDLGAGRIPKGRLAIDHRESDCTDLLIDLNMLLPADPVDLSMKPSDKEELTWELYRDRANEVRAHLLDRCSPVEQQSPVASELPFEDASIESIVSHHVMEHIGPGFEHLMEECYRVLKWDGIMRIIVPLFPSYSAVSEYDHKRYFMAGTLMGFCQEPGDGPSMTDAFAERYNKCCFRMVDEECQPPVEPSKQWTNHDSREIRTTLWKHRPGTHGDVKPSPSEFGGPS